MPASEKTAEFLAEFHVCERRLRAYVRCQVQRIQDAEEVYQEISAVLWTHYDKFQPGSNFFSWACEVARRQVLANHRHRRRMAELIGSELLDQIAVEMLKESESADPRAEALCICLEKLAPYSVHVLRERYYRDKSSAQIAAEQNCSVSAVQKTLKRIYKVLHDCIESVLSDKEAGR